MCRIWPRVGQCPYGRGKNRGPFMLPPLAAVASFCFGGHLGTTVVPRRCPPGAWGEHLRGKLAMISHANQLRVGQPLLPTMPALCKPARAVEQMRGFCGVFGLAVARPDLPGTSGPLSM